MDTSTGTTPHAPVDTRSATDVSTGLYSGPTPPSSRGESAHRALKRSLLLGEFPIAHRLGEERLAARFGTSRTPIREALARLHAEGLVQRHPEGGYEPVFPDMARIDELYEVRRSLEMLGLRRHVDASTDGAHDRQKLIELRAEWLALAADQAEQASGEFVLFDENFHVRLAQASGNRSVAEVLETINERIRIVRVHDFLTIERIGATIVEHLGILDALIEGHVDLATERLSTHIAESASVASARATTTLLRMLTGRI